MLKQAMKTRQEKDAKKPAEQLMVFKLHFHPRGLTRRQLADLYRSSGLAELQPERQLICAQFRPPNLRDIICITVLQDIPGDNQGYPGER